MSSSGALLINTNSVSDCNKYVVTITGSLYQAGTHALYSSATITFNVIVYSIPVHDYITSPVISPVTYYLKDPPMIVNLLPSTPSYAYFPVTYYSLSNSDGTAVNSLLMTLNSLVLTVSSAVATDVGTYSVVLESYFLPSIPYHASSTFLVTVIHYCMRSSINPNTIPDQTYYLTDAALDIPMPLFIASITDCAPLEF